MDDRAMVVVVGVGVHGGASVSPSPSISWPHSFIPGHRTLVVG